MKYFVTMYIKNMQTLSIIPHAFLGLTHTHPDELDSLGDIEINKYRDDYLIGGQFIVKSRGRWYENIYPSILNDEFAGEGFWGFGPENFAFSYPVYKSGKVFENNQYIPKEILR